MKTESIFESFSIPKLSKKGIAASKIIGIKKHEISFLITISSRKLFDNNKNKGTVINKKIPSTRKRMANIMKICHNVAWIMRDEFMKTMKWYSAKHANAQ